MSYTLGIDVGTTYTAAAILRGESVEAVSLGTYQVAVPSVVFAEGDELLFGSAAVRRGVERTSGIAREFKRRVGDSISILLSGSPYHADRLTALMARWVLDSVTEQLGAVPDRVTVTHPANWTEYQRGEFRKALVDVDLGASGQISEPAAAALDYAAAATVAVGTELLVYDLGGGTFDVALLRRTADGFEHVTDPDGNSRLGGIDFDEAVLQRVLGFLPEQVLAQAKASREGVAGLAQLRRLCVEAKEALSSDLTADVPVALPGLVTTVRITRPEFEEMIRPMIIQTIELVRTVVRRAHLGRSSVDAALLVGGSSRIPYVSELVSNELGVPVRIDAHPKLVVAKGAARHAASVGTKKRHGSGRERDRRALDRSSGRDPPNEAPNRSRAAASLDGVDLPTELPVPPTVVPELGARSVLEARAREREPPVDPRWDRAEPSAESVDPRGFDDVHSAPRPPSSDPSSSGPSSIVYSPRSEGSSRRPVFIGVAVAATVVAAGVALVLTRGDDPDDTTGSPVPRLETTTTTDVEFAGADLALLAAGDNAAAAEQALMLSIGHSLSGDPAPTGVGPFASLAQVPEGTDAVIVGPGVALTAAELEQLAASRIAVCFAVPGPTVAELRQRLDLGVPTEARQVAEAALRGEGFTVVSPGSTGVAPDEVALVASGSREVAELLVAEYAAAVGDAARVYDCAATVIAAWWAATGEFDALDLDANGTPCTRLLDCRRDPGSHWSGRDVQMIGIGAGDVRFSCTAGGCETLG